VAGVFGLLSRIRGYVAAIGGTVAALVMAGVLWANPMYVAVYLPPVAALVGVAGLVVWQWERVTRWPEALDVLGRSEKLAPAIMLAAMAVYGVLALWVVTQSDWIGHADYAENAVVARNFVQGRGPVVDYIAQFYEPHPGITHPAETWPLLQPLMIVPLFAIFGAETWAAKLPNIFVMLGLAWMVYLVASRLWDRRVGLLAGLLTLTHPYFFNSAIYPINDLPFTAIFFALAWLVWRAVAPVERETREDDLSTASEGTTRTSASPTPSGDRRFPALQAYLRPVLIGALAGLLVWCKPSGVVLLAGLGIWAAWAWLRFHRPQGKRLPWRKLAVAAGVAALVLLPLVFRNLMSFGQPYFTTESYDAWILRYWPLREWENIYAVYPPDDLPHPRWVLGGKYGYQNLWDAFVLNLRWVWEKGVLGGPDEGEYVLGLFPLALAALGLAGLTRRTANLFGMVGLALGIYAAFVLIYWHFEGRYFQVAVPWLLMLAAWGVFWAWDRLRASPAEGTGRRWGLLLLPVAVAALLLPPLLVIRDQIQREIQPTGFAAAMRWLKENSTAEDVIMTRDPWELNWYTERKAVMIPFGDLDTVRRIAQEHGVTMLQLGGPVDRIDVNDCPADPDSVGPFPTGSRPALGSLYCGKELPGFRLVQRDGGGTIYRLDE
jgi:4-amino-4-deoxy-L-arabinose transferase-like glycosyltransferase